MRPTRDRRLLDLLDNGSVGIEAGRVRLVSNGLGGFLTAIIIVTLVLTAAVLIAVFH